MHDIDGFVYGNQPGLSMCVGDRVSWHIMSGILMHSPLFYGNTVTYNGKRTDAVGQIQGVEHIQKKRQTNKHRRKLVERQQTGGSRDGVVVRALAFHQCVPGSIPGPGARFSMVPKRFRIRKAVAKSQTL